MTHKLVRAVFTAALALLLAGQTASAATKYEGPPAEAMKLGGLSFTSEKNLDVLRMGAPVNLTPEVYRHAVPQRVVLRFNNTIPQESLLNLVAGKRGDCVEKIEVQRLRNYAEGVGSTGGVRQFSEYSTLVIAYVPGDVDAKVTTDAGVVEVVFQRINRDPSRPNPLPINSLEDVTFESLENKEVITFFFTEPVNPRIYEEVDPHRLILLFPSTDVPMKPLNQLRRFMQTPMYFHLEGFNIGSMPQDYSEMDKTREYHFSIYPSPLADDAFGDKIFGKQTRDALVTMYPLDNVTFTMPETEKNVVKVVFEKRAASVDEMVCTKFEPVRTEPELLYSLEDEEGRKVDPGIIKVDDGKYEEPKFNAVGDGE